MYVFADCADFKFSLLFFQEIDDPDTKGDYWKKCFKLMHAFEKGHRVLPPSLYLHDVVIEGNRALRGGGFAVRISIVDASASVSTPGVSTIQDIWKGRMGDEVVCLKVLRMFVENDLDTRDKIVSVRPSFTPSSYANI